MGKGKEQEMLPSMINSQSCFARCSAEVIMLAQLGYSMLGTKQSKRCTQGTGEDK